MKKKAATIRTVRRPSRTGAMKESHEREEREVTCPGCGQNGKEWPDEAGYQMDGKKYCCEGCAEGTGCTC